MQNNYQAHRPYQSRNNRYHPYSSQSHPYQPYWNAGQGQSNPEQGREASQDFYFQNGENNNNPSYGGNYPPQGDHKTSRNNSWGKQPNSRGRGRGSHRGHGGNSYNQQLPQHKPWMTDELLEAIRERNEHQKKAEESKNPDDWTIFKAVRNRTNLLLNDAKRLYEMSNKSRQDNVSENGVPKQPSKGTSAFFCDTCDRSFPNELLLKEHNEEHVVCQLDGCKFTAHPKIILKHIEMQHSNNLFLRVKGYETVEDIEKWKAERRSKYPTEDSLRQKAEEREERLKNRERMFQERRAQQQNESANTPDPDAAQPNNRRISLERRKGREDDQLNSRRHSFPEKQTQPLINQETSKETPPKQAFTFGDSNRPSIPTKRSTSELIVLESFYAQIKISENGALLGKKLLLWNGETQALCQRIAKTGRAMTVAEDEGRHDSDECEEVDSDFITDEEEEHSPEIETHSEPKSKPTKVTTEETPDKKPPAAKPVGSSLSLIGAYSSDSDEEAPEELPAECWREEGEVDDEPNDSSDPVESRVTC